MYVSPNFPTKAACKRAIAAGQRVEVFQPGGLSEPPVNGTVSVEGPHYPKPHSWYGRATIVGGQVTAVK